MNHTSRKILLLVFLWVLSVPVYGQKEYAPKPKYPLLFKTIPTIKDNDPQWIHELYSQEPDIESIENSYRLYYEQHEFIKNVHTQNYKHFIKNVYQNEYILENGKIHIPTLEEVKFQPIENKSGGKGRLAIANWTPIGPFETLRNEGTEHVSSQLNMYTLEQSQSNPDVMIAGTETGGVFLSVDKAEHWTSIGEDLNIGGIGAVAIDPNNELVFYVAQGSYLFKSINQGTTWSIIHSVNNLNITDISVNPNNGQEILTASGLGLYGSSNGGATWVNILPGSRVYDIERKTDDSNTIFVSKLNTTTNVTEVWKSVDNGANFLAKTNGWFVPTNSSAISNQGARIGVTNADPNRLYVLLLGSDISYEEDVNFLGIYRSDDAGETWTLPYDGDGDGFPDNDPGGPYSASDWCMSCFNVNGGSYDQGFYNASLDVSDTDPDLFLVGMLNLFKSEDGATTFTQWGGYQCNNCGSGYRHPDIQEIEINGNDVWVASDGGMDKYNPDFSFIGSKVKGINASENWGFGQGWNEDILVSGRYHNGNSIYKSTYNNGRFIRAGGGEAATGYINMAENKKSYFSDIADKWVPENISDPLLNIGKNLSVYPNEEYGALYRRSEIVNDPRYGNTLYLGKENKLYKSIDEGVSFNVLHEFGNDVSLKISDIEIARANPDVIYVSQYLPGNQGGSKVWKTIDQGSNWVELTLPANDIDIEISVATDNEDILFYSSGKDNSSPDKVFKSLDGGSTWINLTTATLTRQALHLFVQDGTDGGVYYVTFENIYYRNNSMTDWVLFNEGLPARKRFNKLLPFYKDEKLRAATYNRGFYESPLYESSVPYAQPITRYETVTCSRDTVYFDDYSILNHNGASWQWEFPGASYISSTNIRNPKVLYDTPGMYDVTLTVTDGNNLTSSKTVENMINFTEDLCQTSNLAGGVIFLDDNDDYLYTNDISIENVSNFTLTAWIKPSLGVQNGYAAIFYADSDTGALALNFRPDTNQLGFHWNGSQWGWNSGLVVPQDEWSYVAMVVTPNAVTLYLNEQESTRSFNSVPTTLTRTLIGSYSGWGGRNYKGEIEEMTLWDRALSQSEIRLLRHLTKEDIADPNFKAYYQFNSLVNGIAYESINAKDMISSGGVDILDSTAPVGSGNSELMNIITEGLKDFSSVHTKIDFASGILPNGEVVVSILNNSPHQAPNTLALNDTYWIINNYGTNSVFTELNSLEFSNVGTLNEISDVTELKLFKRNSNEFLSDDWGEGPITTATSFDPALQSITYINPGISSFSQFYNGKLDLDIDNDGVIDDADTDPLNPNICRDIDGDGCDDCTITGADYSGGDPSNDGLDTDLDGICNEGDDDDDNDGYTDLEEIACGSDPLDPLDFCEILEIDQTSNITFLLFPNPTDGKLIIRISEQSNVSFHNILGQTVIHPFGLIPGDNEVNLQLTPGVYFVSVSTSQGKLIKKLIVK